MTAPPQNSKTSASPPDPDNTTNPTEIGQAKQTVRPEAADALASAGRGSILNGQSQYFTPAPVAEAIGRALTFRHAPSVVLDPCGLGDGSLAAGLFPAADGTSRADVFGVEIDPVAAGVAARKGCHVITGSTGDAFAVLSEVKDLRFPCVVANPPFSLRWPASCLAPLARCSPGTALAEDYAALSRRPTVDSTVASLLVAVKLLGGGGAGAVIMNRSTFIKKVAPLAAVGHVRKVTSLPKGSFPGVSADIVAVFISGSRSYSAERDWEKEIATPADLDAFADVSSDSYPCYAGGHTGYETLKRWALVEKEHTRRFVEKVPAYNISLREDGTLRAYVTPFQDHAGTFDYRQADRLKSLDRKFPAALVIDSGARDQLMECVTGGLYTVAPDVLSTVRQAVADYQKARAPLYPLPPVKRIGYLDEADAITCKQSTGPFQAGHRYAVQTITVPTSAKAKVRNIATGTVDKVERHGRDLLVRVHHNAPGQPSAGFTDYFTAEGGFVPAARTEDSAGQTLHLDRDNLLPIDKLVAAFDVPDVPDVAAQHPGRYAALREQVLAIGRQIAARVPHKFTGWKDFQVEDFARGALTDGFIKAWEQGLGKSLALGVMPLLWGTRLNLIVAPDSLHPQLLNDLPEFFGIKVTPIDTIEDALADPHLNAALCGREAPDDTPRYYLVSYTALGQNRADQWAHKNGQDIRKLRARTVRDIGTTALAAAEKACRRHINAVRRIEDPDAGPFRGKPSIGQLFHGVGEERDGVLCAARPTLATFLSGVFDCVMADEAVRLKSTDSLQSQGLRTLQPARRLVLTGTPAKNRAPDLFWLAHWACGSPARGCPRWPYADDPSSHTDFENEFTLTEENHSKAERYAEANPGYSRTFKKQIPQITDVHRLWKLIGPVIIRRRKTEIADQLVTKTTRVVRLKPGTHQAAAYAFHVANSPDHTKDGRPLDDSDFKDRVAAVGMQVQNLRSAALCPWDLGLAAFHDDAVGRAHSPDLLTPKLQACLDTVRENLAAGQQTVVLSPFTAFNTALHKLVDAAGVPAALLDGRVDARERGRQAEEFKRFRHAVLVGSIKACGEGLSFPDCPNIILPSLSWALDENAQAVERVYRLNSRHPVTVTVLVTEGTVDERVLQCFEEKRDNADLAVDGTTFRTATQQLTTWDLLEDAVQRHATAADTIDEETLEAGWIAAGRAALADAFATFREAHPEAAASRPTLRDAIDARPSRRKPRRTPAPDTRSRRTASPASPSVADQLARYQKMLLELDPADFQAALADCAA